MCSPQPSRLRSLVGLVFAAMSIVACTHDEAPPPASEEALAVSPRAAIPSPLLRRSPRIPEAPRAAAAAAETPAVNAGEPTAAQNAAAVGSPTSAIPIDIDADPDIGLAPLSVHFSAVLGRQPAGQLSYQWDFGDGSQDTSNPTSHTYSEPGEYTATLTVTDDSGQSGAHDVLIQVDAPKGDAAPE